MKDKYQELYEKMNELVCESKNLVNEIKSSRNKAVKSVNDTIKTLDKIINEIQKMEKDGVISKDTNPTKIYLNLSSIIDNHFKKAFDYIVEAYSMYEEALDNPDNFNKYVTGLKNLK